MNNFTVVSILLKFSQQDGKKVAKSSTLILSLQDQKFLKFQSILLSIKLSWNIKPFQNLHDQWTSENLKTKLSIVLSTFFFFF